MELKEEEDLMVKIEMWQLMTTAGAFLVALLVMVQTVLRSFYKHLDGRFLMLEKELETIRKVETWLHELRAELPKHYVLRDDYIRDRATMEAKVDALAKDVYIGGKEVKP